MQNASIEGQLEKTEEYAVIVNDISMRFNMSHERVDSLKEYLVRLLQRRLFFDEFWAVQDVSFQVKKGEMFGLLGLNGAGKSTVLKIIAGVMKPTKGTVQVNGKMAPLIELGAGFDDSLTAMENVYLNGAVLGYEHKVMRERYREIIEFADLGDFQNTAIRNFSSGMRARLAFSVATAVQPDILIADEILSVGDFKFQEKCLARIDGMRKQGTTILFVSHSIAHVRHHCTQVAWFEKGKMRMLGAVNEVCEAYEHG